jgi:hypothetical protein
MPKILDWQEIMSDYNECNGTQYNSVKNFIKCVYEFHGSIKASAYSIGVSERTLNLKMKSLAIDVRRPGRIQVRFNSNDLSATA